MARATDTLQKVRGTRVAVGIARTRSSNEAGRGAWCRCAASLQVCDRTQIFVRCVGKTWTLTVSLNNDTVASVLESVRSRTGLPVADACLATSQCPRLCPSATLLAAKLWSDSTAVVTWPLRGGGTDPSVGSDDEMTDEDHEMTDDDRDAEMALAALQPDPMDVSDVCATHTHTHARTHAHTHTHTHARAHTLSMVLVCVCV